MSKQIIPTKYTPEEWENLAHSKRIEALGEYSTIVDSYNLLLDIKREIEYYYNIQHQIIAMVGVL